jgi:glutaredoxin
MYPYVIIGQPNCVFCQKAKALLMEKYSDYQYFDIVSQPWLREMFKMSKLKTVPQIFSPQGDLIGGYEELEVYVQTISEAKQTQ